MRAAFFALLLACATPAFSSCGPTDHRCLWEEWKVRYGKSYTSGEEVRRFEAFEKNIEDIARMNSKQPLTHFALNKFSDLSREEFVSHYARLNPKLSKSASGNYAPAPRAPRAALPLNYTSPWDIPVGPNQGTCSGCWAFTVANVVGSAWKKLTGAVEQFSPQQMIDCDLGTGVWGAQWGCDGGFQEIAFDYLVNRTQRGGGLMRYSDYPFTMENFDYGQPLRGQCAYNKSKAVAKVTSSFFVQWDESDQGEMAQQLFDKGPLSVSMDASTLQNYDGGILQDDAECHYSVNHAVTLVGWGQLGANRYWVIKNSWGADWGNEGYFRLARGPAACMTADYPAAGVVVSNGTFPSIDDPICEAKTCGTRQCGSIDTGCKDTILCGSGCSNGMTCNSQLSCESMRSVSGWTQFLNGSNVGDFSVTNSSSGVSVNTTTATSSLKFIKWVDSAKWLSQHYTSFSVDATATASGVIGLGFAKSTGSNDGVWCKLDFSSTTNSAAASACATVLGQTQCMSPHKTVAFAKNKPVNLRVTFIRDATKFGIRLFVNGTSVTGADYVYFPASFVSDTMGPAFLVASYGGKKFSNPSISTQTRWKLTLDDICVQTDSFLFDLGFIMSIPGSVITNVANESKIGCDAGTFNQFTFTFTDAKKSKKSSFSVDNHQMSRTLFDRVSYMISEGTLQRMGYGQISGVAVVPQKLTGSGYTFPDGNSPGGFASSLSVPAFIMMATLLLCALF